MVAVSMPTPAGSPSTMATSAGPCDSPAVIQRNTRGFSQTRAGTGHDGGVDAHPGWRLDPEPMRPVLTDRQRVETALVAAGPLDRLILLPLLGRVDQALAEAEEL